MSDIQNAFDKLEIKEDDVLLCDPRTVSIDDLKEIRGRYPTPIIFVIPVEGKSLSESLATMPKDEAAEILKTLC
jgi:hypothetical protein